MSVPLWVVETGASFWADAGEEEVFPRQLRRSIGRSQPLAILGRPGLHSGAVQRWLAERNIPCPLGERQRRLRACLVAFDGHGYAFIDSTDSPEEQRFSIAHELAHFLHDYRAPRRRAVQRLGERVLEVFDGKRPPTAEERLHALLSSVRVGFHTHLLARDSDDRPAAVSRVEHDADRLAYELLAPAAAVLGRVNRSGGRDAASRVLREVFGLPSLQAARYATLLLPPPPLDALLARLRSARKK